MPGNGDVTGGTCKVRFKIKGHREKRDHDNSVEAKCPVRVRVTFPGGSARIVTLKKGQRIHFQWPWP